MTRKDVRLIAARLNNPILLLAIERHEYHGEAWEIAINQAVIELARQNDYFLDQLITKGTGGKSSPMTAVKPSRPVRTGKLLDASANEGDADSTATQPPFLSRPDRIAS